MENIVDVAFTSSGSMALVSNVTSQGKARNRLVKRELPRVFRSVECEDSGAVIGTARLQPYLKAARWLLF
jgi:hypothetical protein